MAGNIIYICGPEYSGKTYMALGLAERLGDFDISHVFFNIEDMFDAQEGILKSERVATFMIDGLTKTPHPTISKYKLVETLLRMASRDNNIIMTAYPGDSIWDVLPEMAMRFIASRDVNIVRIELHSRNDPSYLKVMGITPSKDILEKYDARFKEAIKS